MRQIHLILTVDRNHLVGCAATIRSVIEHADPAAGLRFHLAVDGVPEPARDRLRASAQADGRDIELRFWEFPVERVQHLVRSRLVSHTAYARLFVDDIVPADVARGIYLDSDLIVARDIAELIDAPLGGCTVGAVENLGATEQAEHQRRLGLRSPRYFNSGVLLIDLRRWREQRVSQRALEAAERIGDRLVLHDQDALNCALEDDWAVIPGHWNVAVATPALRADAAVVFHFMGAPKPWDVDYDGPFSELFARYRDRTAFRDDTPWNPAGLGRVLARARRRLPYLPGALRLLRLAFRKEKP